MFCVFFVCFFCSWGKGSGFYFLGFGFEDVVRGCLFFLVEWLGLFGCVCVCGSLFLDFRRGCWIEIWVIGMERYYL